MKNSYQILNERAKELRCLYSVEELLKDKSKDKEDVFRELLDIIPAGWQHSTICEAKIIYNNSEYYRKDFKETEWKQTAELVVDNNIAGNIQVFYTQFINYHHNGSQFIPDEQRLLNTIAGRLSNYLFYQKLEQTIKLLNSPDHDSHASEQNKVLSTSSDEHWKWRYQMAEKIAEKLDLERFGVSAIYLIGSTKNADAGPGSDIDIMIHFRGSDMQRSEMVAWIEGWSLCLAELNYIKTGYLKSDGLIDLHIITDKDIEKRDSFASMIGSVHNSARLLKK